MRGCTVPEADGVGTVVVRVVGWRCDVSTDGVARQSTSDHSLGRERRRAAGIRQVICKITGWMAMLRERDEWSDGSMGLSVAGADSVAQTIGPRFE